MIDPEPLLSNPVAAVGLRAVFGIYLIYMARRFYADPTGYFRKSARNLVDLPWLEPTIRALAAFCLWGGCFIVAAAVAVQILGLHGNTLAVVLVALAAVAAWILLPRPSGVESEP
jgi:hypothetical protein